MVVDKWEDVTEEKLNNEYEHYKSRLNEFNDKSWFDSKFWMTNK
jgi:hypothetical protein